MGSELKDYLRLKEEEWEDMCIRCGGCCGAFDDPCEHLCKDGNGKYYCDIYLHRFGRRRTVSGEVFDCVPVKKILDRHWKNDFLCAYKQYRPFPWFKLK
ncbi:MAG: hypothetical protein GF375_00875 [Candidatus Omnitrophica bacterium]|nr:hypothetical protein [Candidatus Omnitrophota bacterium]MBD3268700.1 hypothetical protein [Candidatus Omnitrophota bacterium]